MAFEKVRFFDYRNLRNQSALLEAPEIFLIGGNGQGKTNFIESIYLLCYGSSFRTTHDRRLIKEGNNIALVEGRAVDRVSNRRDITVKLYEDRKKEIRVDTSNLIDRKDLLGINPCVVFSHTDIHFVDGPPEIRRKFFNQTVSLFDPFFIDILRKYKRILKYRNIVLREKKYQFLDIYDSQLGSLGWNIQQIRKKTVGEFNLTFKPLFREISGLDIELDIFYEPSWKEAHSDEDAVSFLIAGRDRDAVLGMTTTGPHRDRIHYYCEDKDFSQTASTGQLRLLSLILKTAQAQHFKKVTGIDPILLLDDVLLELDTEKKIAFLENLPSYEQAFFTFLPDEKFLNYKRDNTILYSVNNGCIEPWKELVMY